MFILLFIFSWLNFIFNHFFHKLFVFVCLSKLVTSINWFIPHFFNHSITIISIITLDLKISVFVVITFFLTLKQIWLDMSQSSLDFINFFLLFNYNLCHNFFMVLCTGIVALPSMRQNYSFDLRPWPVTEIHKSFHACSLFISRGAGPYITYYFIIILISSSSFLWEGRSFSLDWLFQFLNLSSLILWWHNLFFLKSVLG